MKKTTSFIIKSVILTKSHPFTLGKMGSGNIPPGNLDTTARTQSFWFPTAYECKKVQILLHKVGFDCPHHIMVSLPLNLHS